MIQSYIAELQNRVNIINQLLGDLPQPYETQLKSAKQKIDQITSKIITGKDTQHKFNKLNTFIKKHTDIIDTTITTDKTNIIIDQLDQLKQLSESLNKIQKLLPAMDTTDYIKYRNQYNNINMLNTASAIQLNKNNDGIQVVLYDCTSIDQIREQQRSEMSSIVELNYRMLNNVNEKLRLARERKFRK